MARKPTPIRADDSGRFQTEGEEHAERFNAAIETFQAAMPNEYQTVCAMRFSEGVKRVNRYLRTGE